MTLDKIVKKIEAEGFQWAVNRDVNGLYTAYVCEQPDIYIADALTGGLGCEEGSTAAVALETAFYKELGYREKRKSAG